MAQISDVAQGQATVLEQTGGLIDDGHFSENAHKVLSEQLIDIIDNYNFTKLSNASNFLI